MQSSLIDDYRGFNLSCVVLVILYLILNNRVDSKVIIVYVDVLYEGDFLRLLWHSILVC